MTAFSDPFRRCSWPTLLSLLLPWCLAVSLYHSFSLQRLWTGRRKGTGLQSRQCHPCALWEHMAAGGSVAISLLGLSVAVCNLMSLCLCAVSRVLWGVLGSPVFKPLSLPFPPCLSLLQVCVCSPHCLSLAVLSHSACLSYSWLFITLARPLWLLPPGTGEPCPLSLGVFGYCPRSQGQHAAIRPPHPAATAQGSAQAASSSEVPWLQEKQACSFLSRSAQQ